MATKSTKKKVAPKKAAKRSARKAKAAPKAKAPAKAKAAPKTPATTKADAAVRERDPRLPRPGGVLIRSFQGKEHKVQVLDAGFLYEGKTWRSLSAIAKAISGTSWNGYLFWGLQTRAKAPAANGQTGGAK
jgi:Protein of unknown function (DUF2924)